MDIEQMIIFLEEMNAVTTPKSTDYFLYCLCDKNRIQCPQLLLSYEVVCYVMLFMVTMYMLLESLHCAIGAMHLEICEGHSNTEKINLPIGRYIQAGPNILKVMGLSRGGETGCNSWFPFQ